MSRHTQSLMQPDGDIIVAPGVWDALTTRLVADTGFAAAYLTGYGFEATQLGAPDVGMMTLTELATQVARITAAVDIPLICDVDTGFGGINNVWRTVRELERAGAAAIQIEDQVSPKRCPVIEGKELVSREQAVGRIRLAVESREEMLIIARTDADELGFDEMVTRCNLFLDAGADLVMPMMLSIEGRRLYEMHPDEQMEWRARLAGEIHGPTISTDVPLGYSVGDLQDIGAHAVILPAMLLDATITAAKGALESTRANGTTERYFAANPSSDLRGRVFLDMLGLPDYLERENRFDPQPKPARETAAVNA